MTDTRVYDPPEMRSPPMPLPDGGYAETWLRVLRMRIPVEQLDCVQAQFLDNEARAAHLDFVRRHAGLAHTSVSLCDRARIVRAACDVLLGHGRRPRVDWFWFPDVAADVAREVSLRCATVRA